MADERIVRALVRDVSKLLALSSAKTSHKDGVASE